MSFTVVYLCLWWVSVKWLNFSRISFALKYTYTHHNKTMQYIIMQTVIRTRTFPIQLIQLRTYFTRHEEGREESPLHMEACGLRKPSRRKWANELYWTTVKQFQPPVIYMLLLYSKNCSLSILSADLHPAGVDIGSEQGWMRVGVYVITGLVVLSTGLMKQSSEYNEEIKARGQPLCVCVCCHGSLIVFKVGWKQKPDEPLVFSRQ